MHAFGIQHCKAVPATVSSLDGDLQRRVEVLMPPGTPSWSFLRVTDAVFGPDGNDCAHPCGPSTCLAYWTQMLAPQLKESEAVYFDPADGVTYTGWFLPFEVGCWINDRLSVEAVNMQDE